MTSRDDLIRQAFQQLRLGLSTLESALLMERKPNETAGAFMTKLLKNLEKRREENGHAYVTANEAGFLVANDLAQPGHSKHRYSTASEDLSDATQAAGELLYNAQFRLTDEETDEFLALVWSEGLDDRTAMGRVMAKRVAQQGGEVSNVNG